MSFIIRVLGIFVKYNLKTKIKIISENSEILVVPGWMRPDCRPRCSPPAVHWSVPKIQSYQEKKKITSSRSLLSSTNNCTERAFRVQQSVKVAIQKRNK